MPTEPYLSQIALFSFNFAPRGWARCDGQLLPINQNQALFSLLGTTYGGDGRTTFALPDLRGRVPLGVGAGHTLGENGGSETVALVVTQMPAHGHAINIAALTAAENCQNGIGSQLTPAGNVLASDPYTPFTDDALIARSTTVRAVHIMELRSRIDALRNGLMLPTYPYVDPALSAGTTIVRALHIIDLRAALADVYVAANLPPPTYTDASLAAGTAIKAAHIAQLRTAVLAAGSGATYNSAAPDANMNAGAIAVGGSVTAANTGGGQGHENRQPCLAVTYCIALQGVFPSQS